MSKKPTKQLSLVLAVLLILSCTATGVFAAQPPEISPQWDNVNGVTSEITFDVSSIISEIYIMGKSGTTFYSGTVVLEKVTGSDTGIVATWTNLSSNTNSFSFYETVNTTPTSGRYKLTINIWTVRNGVTEKINKSTSKLY